MEITIKIPKEFEEYFKSDRFEDILQRVRFDIHKSIIGGKFVLSGNREKEALDMLTDAFLNSTPLPEHHGRLIDADALKKHKYHDNNRYENAVAVAQIDWAPTILEADKCTYKETGCGSCKRQLDCPIETEGSESE